ncbi:hypothetical protein D3C71_1230660 [compost metagenome]
MMPSGVPNTVAHRINRPLPAMAFARPPPAVFGGGVISVNSASDMPSMPLVTVENRIHTSQNRPNTMVAIDRNSASRFFWRRQACILRRLSSSATLFCISIVVTLASLTLCQAHHHQLRQRQHDKGDNKQNQPQLHQRGGVHARLRFGEFVGQCRGDAVARHIQ